MGRKKRIFTKEFKQESGERSGTEVAQSLGIHQSLLSKWIEASRNEGEEAFRGRGKRTAIEEENWQLKLKNKQLEQELEFLKSEPVLREGPEVKYRHIREHSGQYTLSVMCRALKVTPQEYYQWHARSPRGLERQRNERALRDRVRIAYAKGRRTKAALKFKALAALSSEYARPRLYSDSTESEVGWRYQCAVASATDDGGESPSVAGLQDQATNHRRRHVLRGCVVSAAEKVLYEASGGK